MNKERVNVFPSESLKLWDPPEESMYYDIKMDLQGEVPGCSLEEARKAFENKYGISLSKE